MTQPPSWPDQPAAGGAADGPPPPSPADAPPAPQTPPPPGQPPPPHTPPQHTPPSYGPPQHTPPSYGPPPPPAPAQPLYPGTPYGAPQAPPGGYGYGYPYQSTQGNNGMAVASMVVSIVSAAGLCAYGFGGLLGVLGAILGHVARRQIRLRYEGGEGMALAGIIVGWIAFGLGLIISAAFVVFFAVAFNDPAFQSDPF